jgi:hypothetical protein
LISLNFPKLLRSTKGQALLLCLRCLLYAPSKPRLVCYAVKGSLRRFAPLTAQTGEALVRYEDGSGGQAKRGKQQNSRKEKQICPSRPALRLTRPMPQAGLIEHQTDSTA